MLLMDGAMAVGGGDLTVVSDFVVLSVTMVSAKATDIDRDNTTPAQNFLLLYILV